MTNVQDSMPAVLTEVPGSPRVQVGLLYDTTRPFEVRIGVQRLEWSVGREFLHRGLHARVGTEGNCQMWPLVNFHGVLVLPGPEGDVRLWCPQFNLLDGFLQRTYTIVPSGREPHHFDRTLDVELHQLLGGAS